MEEAPHLGRGYMLIGRSGHHEPGPRLFPHDIAQAKYAQGTEAATF